MTEEREIWACPNLLLGRHGAEAGAFAASRAETLRAGGDRAGQATFLRIRARIEELEIVVSTSPMQ